MRKRYFGEYDSVKLFEIIEVFNLKVQRYVVIDLETTGNSPKKGDRIIQIAAVVIENNQIVDRYMSFVNPLQSIPLFIEQLTGITNEMVENAPTFDEIVKDIHTLLRDSYFIAHNVYFDLSFLQEEFMRCGYQFSGPVIDTVELSRMAFPTEKSYKLSDLSEEFKMDHENPHRADSDAEATALLFLHIIKKLTELPMITLQQLSKLSRSFISDMEEVFEQILSEKLVNLEQQIHPDIEIVRTLALRKRMKENEASLTSIFSKEQVLDLFSNKNDEIKRAFPLFHERVGQIKMIEDIIEAFLTHQHVLIEAATGIGKTMAYLVSAIFYSLQESRPIVISTYTNNLQMQIMEQEIPVLKKLLPVSFSATLLKGQSHYLCLQKFEQSLKNSDDNYDYILTKAQILIWLTETVSGDLDELNLPSGGKTIWDNLHVDQSSFLNNPFQPYCFYQQAKEKALSANIIITNHAMLLSDLSRDQKLLPTYQEVIIDEAHHFHHVATEQLGVRFHYLDLHHLIHNLGNTHSTGLLEQFVKIQNEHKFSASFNKIDDLLIQLQEENHQFFAGLHSYVLKQKKDSPLNRASYRYLPNKENNRTWASLLELAKRLQFMMKDIIHLMEKESQGIDESYIMSKSIKEKLVLEDFKQSISLLETYKNHFDFLFFEHNDLVVRWIEIDTKGAKNAVSIYAQPIEVNDYLADEFFSHIQSAILTSATLTIKKSFAYMLQTIGLSDFYPKQLRIETPFNYENQVKMFIPSDMPNVNDVTLEEYSEAIAVHISTVSQITEGKLLVLFTSYEMLRKTYALLKEDETLEDFVIMGQGTGSGSRSKLTKNFRQFDKAILLGTSSFWEGVDFPGNQLKALMIVRLPFASPDEPTVAATCQLLESKGMNSFYHYSLPEAILRFKQGFGRLIRNEKDKGVLFILDNRILSTKYGRDFITSIPYLEIEHKPMHLLTHAIDDWINE